MNIRQKLYKKYRLKGLSAYQSAIKAGYRHATALHAHTNIEKRINFTDVLIKYGIDDESLSKLISDGLMAKKPIACDVFIREKNGKLIVSKNSNDWIEYEDWNARHKFIETVLGLQGRLKMKFEHSGKIEHEHTLFFESLVEKAIPNRIVEHASNN